MPDQMKVISVPVTWSVYGVIKVPVPAHLCKQQAISLAMKSVEYEEVSLPEIDGYVDGSFELTGEEMTSYLYDKDYPYSGRRDNDD